MIVCFVCCCFWRAKRVYWRVVLASVEPGYFGWERKAEKRKEKYRKNYKEKTILRIVEKKVYKKDKSAH